MSLIALDLDGTLLGDDGALSERNAAAVRAAAAAGHRVVIATGRPAELVVHLAPALGGAVSHVIGTNGSTITTFPDGRLLRFVRFDLDAARDAVRAIRTLDSGYRFALATDEDFAFEGGFAERMPAEVLGDPVDDVLRLGGRDVYKLFVFHLERHVDEVVAHVGPVLDDSLAVQHMGADAAEIGPAAVDKRAGLIWLCEHLGVDRNDVVAIGDAPNDLTMLQWAGRAIAVENAHDSVIAVADAVCGSNGSDGVADALEGLPPATVG